MNKHYCYVDETGLDTEGALFIVGIAVVNTERELFIETLERIERQSGKGRTKWNKAPYESRLAYMQGVLSRHEFAGRLYYDVHRNHAQSYLHLTVLSISKTIRCYQDEDSESIVLIDSLPESKIQIVANLLRDEKLAIDKVRGVRREEHDALVRLADALCGFVRAALEGQPNMKRLFDQGHSKGHLIDVSGKEKNPRS